MRQISFCGIVSYNPLYETIVQWKFSGGDLARSKHLSSPSLIKIVVCKRNIQSAITVPTYVQPTHEETLRVAK